jgi:hypothetical protein
MVVQLEMHHHLPQQKKTWWGHRDSASSHLPHSPWHSRTVREPTSYCGNGHWAGKHPQFPLPMSHDSPDAPIEQHNKGGTVGRCQ